MKSILIPAVLFFGVQSFAAVKDASPENLLRVPKATICYEEASVYASTLARDSHATIGEGKLQMFTNIGGVQVEGWSFPTSRKATLLIVASGDGDDGYVCRVNFAPNR